MLDYVCQENLHNSSIEILHETENLPPYATAMTSVILHKNRSFPREVFWAFLQWQFCRFFFTKMTQINFVSRNQFHNTARSRQHLNFVLSGPGLGQSVKSKHCYSLKFSLLGTDTALSQSSIGAQYSKQNMIKFSQCLAELAQKFKFL